MTQLPAVWRLSCWAAVDTWGVSCVCLTCVHVCCCACDREQTDGTTPLIAASANGHVGVVRALVDRGAVVNQADVCLRALWSMLRLLVFWSVVRTLPVLVHGGASSQRVLCQMLDC